MSIRAPRDVEVTDAIEARVLSRVNKFDPAEVLAYDDVKKTARVQLRRRVRLPDGTMVEPPVIPAAMVLWPRFAGMIIMGRLEKGDEVLCGYCDREIDRWAAKGGIVDAASERMHSRADAVVITGLSSGRDPLPASGGQFTIGREDGTATISISIDGAGAVTIEAATIRLGEGATEPAVLGTTLQTALLTFASAVSGATTAAQIAGFAGTLNTALANILATKAKVS